MTESQYEGRNSVRMPDGRYRVLPAASEIEPHLAIRERDFPDGRRVLSFSLLGVWTGVATRKEFVEWSERAASVFRPEVDYIKSSADGVDDVFVDAVRARNAFGFSLSHRARVSCEIIEAAVREASVRKNREEAEAQAKADLNAELASLMALPDPEVRRRRFRQLFGPDVDRYPGLVSDQVVAGLLDDDQSEGFPDDVGDDLAGGDPAGWRPELSRFVPVTRCEIGGREVDGVSARDMHAFLGVSTQFPLWLLRQAKKCRLEEGPDYRHGVFFKNGENSSVGRPREESVLTLAAAKEIGMADKSARGKELRLYFLDCERRVLAAEGSTPLASMGISDPAQAAPPALSRHCGFLSQSSIPLTLWQFLAARGVSAHFAGPMARFHAPRLAKALVSGDALGLCAVHPSTGELVFDDQALTAWWRSAEPEVMSTVLGLDAVQD